MGHHRTLVQTLCDMGYELEVRYARDHQATVAVCDPRRNLVISVVTAPRLDEALDRLERQFVPPVDMEE